MDRDSPTNSAPDLGAVFARCDASNVDFHTANACNRVLHGSRQSVLIHELSDSTASTTHASKHMKLLLAENPLTSSNSRDSIVPPASMDRCCNLLFLRRLVGSFDDCPAPEKADLPPSQQWKKVGQVFNTVMWKVDQKKIR